MFMLKKLQKNMDDEGSKQKQKSNISSNDSNVSEPNGLRCTFLHGFKNDKRFLRNYYLYFLPIISFFIWIIFLFN